MGAAGLGLAGSAGARVPAGAMNVVVVVMDSLRVDHVYGSRARTPTLDAMARQGLSLTRAFPEGMPTIPARRAIMSGRRTFPFRGWRPHRGLPPQPGWAPVGSDGRMWTEVLGDRGWTTGYVTDNPHLLLGVHKSFRSRFDRVGLVDGQVPLRRKPGRSVSRAELNRHLPPALRGSRAAPRMAAYLAANPRGRAEEDHLAARVFRKGMSWVDWALPRGPFALVIDTFDAHEPWDAPRRLRSLYGPAAVRGVEPIQPFPTPSARHDALGLSGTLLRRMRQLYAAEVTLVDRWLGRFIERLEELGVMENTLLVLLSDHGVLLGEYGWVGKRYSEMHTELCHVPFVIRHPGGRRRTSDYWASTHDVGPTVLSLLGQPIPRAMDGADLSPLLDGRAPRRKRKYASASYNDHVSVRDGRWLLIADNRGRDKRLYSLEREGRDVARRHPNVVRRLWGYILDDAGPRGLPRLP